MALYTTDYFIRPSDGWTLVATNPAELRIKPAVYHPWWVAITDSGAPAATVLGVPMGRDPSNRNEDYFLPNGVTGEVYIRISTPTDSNTVETMEFNVTAVTAAAVPSLTAQIEGVVADGTAKTGVNPVLVAGQDGTNVQSLLTDSSGRLELAATTDSAGPSIIGNVGGITTRPTANFTRPNDTTPYAVGDLVANSTTAGSVTPMQFSVGRLPSAGGMLRRVRLKKSNTGVDNALFRLHLYSTSPTPSNGDNGAWLTNNAANYVGAMDIAVDKVFTDGAVGVGVPQNGTEINFTSETYYGLLEARGTYTPAAQEVFTLDLEDLQN